MTRKLKTEWYRVRKAESGFSKGAVIQMRRDPHQPDLLFFTGGLIPVSNANFARVSCLRVGYLKAKRHIAMWLLANFGRR